MISFLCRSRFATSSSDMMILTAVDSPRTCNFDQTLHFSQPTQFMMELIFWKILCTRLRAINWYIHKQVMNESPQWSAA